MNLTERLTQYGMTEREDGTLMIPFENRSGFVQVQVRAGQVWMRDLLADGRPALGDFGDGDVSVRNSCGGCCSATRPLLNGCGPGAHQ